MDTSGPATHTRVQDFCRLFILLDVGHCAGPDDIGPDDIGAENQTAISSDPEHDAISTSLGWVEHGAAPRQLIATKFNNNDPTQGIEIQCPKKGREENETQH
jgi:feruloyl esterase